MRDGVPLFNLKRFQERDPVSETLGPRLRDATRLLADAGVDSPRLSAELLLCAAVGISRVQLATHPERPVSDGEAQRFDALVRRRAAGEPVAYLLGVQEFFGRDFKVTPATLVPRPETELLIEAALEAGELPAGNCLRFADFGTGSGCIAITLCLERPAWSGIAIDLSFNALSVARHNAMTLGVGQRLSLLQADFVNPPVKLHSLDLLISNPPYVSCAEYAELSPEVQKYEPALALVPKGQTGGSSDGLEDEKRLIDVAAQLLKPGGVLLMEHGWTQAPALSLLLERHTWNKVSLNKDLSGKQRYIKAVLR